jgi:anti-sigma-K factor RskA
MTDEPELTGPELTGDDRLAAELALGLLEGEELAQARWRQGRDTDFDRAIASWEERLMPLIDGVRPVAPDPRVWEQIAARLGDREEGANVVELRRKASLWRTYSAGMTALAAALALVIGLDAARQDPVVQAPAPQPPGATLVAALAKEGGPAALVITYDPNSRSLVATPAVLDPAAGHDHELWLIAGSEPPRSLGLVATGKSQKITIPPALLKSLGTEATLAVSVEPEGGSRTGKPTGPVIASGQLIRL